MSEKPTYEELENRIRELEKRLRIDPPAESQKALKRSEEHLRLITDNLPALISHVDKDLTCLFANKAYLSICGVSPEELIGKKVSEVLDKEAFERAYPYVQKALIGELASMENYIASKEDQDTFFQVNFVPHFEENEVAGYFVLGWDITGRKQAEEERAQVLARLQTTFDATADGILVVSCEREIITYNKRFIKFWEIPKKILETRKSEKYLSYVLEKLEDPEVFLSKVQYLYANPAEKSFDTFKFKDGRVFERYSRPHFLNNKIIGRVWSFRDVTKRKQAEEELKSTNNFLTQILNSSFTTSILSTDLQQNIRYWNKGAENIFGYKAEDVIGRKIDILYPTSEEKKQVDKLREKIRREKKEISTELREVTKDGKEKWIKVNLSPILNDNGNVIGIQGMGEDITERKHLEESLRQSHKLEAIGTLAGGIAHEFNNMLGIIIGNTELVLDDIPEWNPAADCIQEIRTASLRAKEVVRKLLSVARKSPSARKPIQISSIIKESLGLVRKTIPTTIDIRQKIRCETEMILGDATEINQIVINLLTNSVHAMSEQTGVLEVVLEIVQQDNNSAIRYEDLNPGDYAKLTVRDSGSGIKPELIERVFDPYFTTKDIDEGLGMGLAVVHGIVKKHDGAINIESEVGKGTTVEVLFPLIEEQEVVSTEETDKLPAGTERILMVDDEPSLVKMVTQFLERSGYEVLGKTSSTDALQVFKEAPDQFDLVITDMAMPEMSGERMAQEIIQVRPDVSIILCTGHSDRMDENRAIELGIKAFVTKPMGKADLVKTVRKVLDEAKSAAQG